MKRDDLEKIGGPSNVAKICGVCPAAVSMWFAPEEKGGRGGKIPYKRAKMIVAYAAKLGIYWDLEYVIGE